MLISHEFYDKFNHLDTVSSLYKLIEERMQKYRGVALKYINRYNALFVMRRETQGIDNTEKLQYVLLRLKNIYKITRLKDLKNEWLYVLVIKSYQLVIYINKKIWRKCHTFFILCF